MDLFACFLACTGLLFYVHVAPVLTISGILVVVISVFFSVHRHRKIAGVVCTLNYHVDEACFTTFLSNDTHGALDIKSVSMLWRSSYCALIRIECSQREWKQWIYAAETSPECYCRLLRVLR